MTLRKVFTPIFIAFILLTVTAHTLLGLTLTTQGIFMQIQKPDRLDQLVCVVEHSAAKEPIQKQK